MSDSEKTTEQIEYEKYCQKTEEWIRQHGRGTVIATVAAKNYRRHGRGHVMVYCKKPKAARRADQPNFQYITEHHNHRIVRIDPRAADPALDKMVREYDPTRQAVVVAYWGFKYITFTMNIEPQPEKVAGEH